MKFIEKISIKISANIIISILLCTFIFHVFVLTGVIPYDIVWGGRLENISQMYVFEFISLAINSIIMIVVCIKVGYVKTYINLKFINIILWFLVVVFLLNTVGNIVSFSILESIIFTPLTFISALLFYRMAIENIK
jgi:hypothetical protein